MCIVQSIGRRTHCSSIETSFRGVETWSWRDVRSTCVCHTTSLHSLENDTSTIIITSLLCTEDRLGIAYLGYSYGSPVLSAYGDMYLYDYVI